MHKLALVALIVAVAGLLAGATKASRSAEPTVAEKTVAGKTIIEWRQIAVRRRVDRDWLQHRLGVRVRQLLALHRRFHAAPTRPPHYAEWLCIHRGEGAWTANTGNGFYGGLQFTDGTWRSSGGLRFASRADLASPLEQMWAAENAWADMGGSFSPWPNTARACGLL